MGRRHERETAQGPGVGGVVDESAKGQHSMIKEFWKRKDPLLRRVSRWMFVSRTVVEGVSIIVL